MILIPPGEIYMLQHLRVVQMERNQEIYKEIYTVYM